MRSYARSKVDRNHGEIVAALRAVGAHVLDLSAVGHGCPDLLCLFRGTLTLLEIKDGKRPPSERKLNPEQEKFHALWRPVVHVVTNRDEAWKAIGAVVS